MQFIRHYEIMDPVMKHKTRHCEKKEGNKQDAFFHGTYLKNKFNHMAEIEGQAYSNNMQYPPPWFVSHKIFKHDPITSIEGALGYRPVLFRQNGLSTSLCEES
jgi:hypothetical protein